MSIQAYVRGGVLDAARARRIRRDLLTAEAAHEVAETFSMLGDATRTRILQALSLEELCVSDLSALLDVSQSAASHQLRMLRDRRLVAVRRDGRRTFYRLRDEHIRTLVDMGVSHAAEEDGAARRRRAR
jgi:DNA-binding transcriptional ArsR family regulator